MQPAKNKFAVTLPSSSYFIFTHKYNKVARLDQFEAETQIHWLS